MNKSISIVLVGAVAAGLLGLLIAHGGIAQAAPDVDVSDADVDMLDIGKHHPQEISSGTISVTGYAETTMDPELLVVRFGVGITEPTAVEALDENKRMVDEVIKAIMSTGVDEDEIRTSNINISPQYTDEWDDYGMYTEVLAGYHVSNIVTVSTYNLTIAADMLDSAVEAGVNTVESVDFTLSPKTEKSVHERLLTEATSDAKHKAEIVLAQLDQEIVGVKSVTVDIKDEIEQVTDAISPLTDLFAAVSDESTSTLSSDQTRETSVVVTFLIGPK